MILTILILLGIGLAVYTCILHSIGPILGILLAVGYTLGCIIVFLLLVALLSVFIRIDRPADRRTRFYHWLMTNIVQVGMFLLRVRVNVTGREKTPHDTRFLLVSNHRTIFRSCPHHGGAFGIHPGIHLQKGEFQDPHRQ